MAIHHTNAAQDHDMNKQTLLNKAAPAALMALMLGTALAQDNPPPMVVERPTSAQWYEQGQEAVRAAQQLQPNTGKARNVILFVGDGMGVTTVTAARILEGQQRNADGESNRLSFEKFPYLAHSVTASANQQTSDSAPTATAMVTGIKTNEGALSVDQNIAKNESSAEVIAAASLQTILEQAEANGLSTGVVSTARITHATPAANYAHIGNRDWEGDALLPAGSTVKDIAAQLIDFPHGNGIDVALGGGRAFFMSNQSVDPEYPALKGMRNDNRNLIDQWLTQTHSAYVWDQAGFAAIDTAKTNHLLGLFEPLHMQYSVDQHKDGAGEPTLAAMTATAIEILQKNPDGFYLMVEAGRIDHAHHDGNAYRALTDTIALDEAVRMAQAMTSSDDTLIIVTADHSHTFTLAGYPSRGNPILGKAAINGVPQKDLSGKPYSTLGYANGPGYTGDGPRPDLSAIDTMHPDYLQEAAIPLEDETHGGEDVAIYADGPLAHLFHGTMEQNVIYHVMAAALGLNQQ
jgi:alkaline phosphatase